MTFAFLKLISVLVQQVHIVIQRMILLLCLDESSHYLFNVLDSSGFLDLFKSIFDNTGVSHVLIQESFLFFVSWNNFAESQLKNGNRVSEFLLNASWALGLRHCLIKGLVIELNRFITFLQSLLKFLDLKFEAFFLFFMFSLESQDLVVRLISLLATLDVLFVSRECFFLDSSNLSPHLLDAVLGKPV